MHICTFSVAMPPPKVSADPYLLQVVRSVNLFDITVDDQLTWEQHVSTTFKSASYKIYMLLWLI